MPTRAKTVLYMIIVSGLILSAAACKKNTGRGSDWGSNVYVLGTNGDTVIYWKNGVARNLYSQSQVMISSRNPSLFVSGNDVYIAGNLPNTTTTYSTVALYWKNEIATFLRDSSGDAAASSIFVSGNDVYVAGITHYFVDTSHVPYTTPAGIYPTVGKVATIWKNGVAASLPCFGTIGLVGGGQYAVRVHEDYVSSIFVSGNDVYASGGSRYWGNNARYWKNGVPTDLSNALTYYGANGSLCYPTTTSISVSGNDVYVAGYQLTSTRRTTALYWKNGVASYLTTDSISGSEANSLFVSGNDVYIAGYQNVNNYSRAMYWKNGVPVTLTTEARSAAANSIFVAGNDVYVAGYQWTIGGYYIATYWKNGEAVKLTDGTKNVIANSIYIQ